MADEQKPKSFWRDTITFFRTHPLQSGVGLWGCLMVGTFLHVMNRRTTLANKIINARLVRVAVCCVTLS